VRRTDPARALNLLSATWKEETPEDRARFAAQLQIGLSSSDEAFLESTLDDKRKEVRRAAAIALGCIPGSALVSRMTERAQPLLHFKPGEPGRLLKLKRGSPASLEVTLPSECDKAMQRDGIEPKPEHGFGERAWWMMQILEVVPLDVWTSRWNTTPSEVLSASLGSEWKKELFEAWTRAAARQKNAAWAVALFDTALEGKWLDKFQGLLAALPVAQREEWLARLLADSQASTRALHGTLIAQCQHEWGPAFSRAVLAWLRNAVAEQSSDWPLRNQLKDFALRLAPAVLTQVQSGWPTESAGWPFWSKGVDDFLAVAQFRAELRGALGSKGG